MCMCVCMCACAVHQVVIDLGPMTAVAGATTSVPWRASCAACARSAWDPSRWGAFAQARCTADPAADRAVRSPAAPGCAAGCLWPLAAGEGSACACPLPLPWVHPQQR
jgi:hypothetical protein